MIFMKNVLITGGCGFIGSNFVRYLLENRLCRKLVNYDKLTYAGNPDNLKDIENDSRYVFVKGDICDKSCFRNTVESNCVDTVVHLAAESHVDRSICDASLFVRTNVLGTHVILDVVKDYDLRFHHVSTDEVYGSLGREGKFTESSPYLPQSPYSATKAASDHLVRAYVNTYGIRATISNCPNNYGPYQHPEKLIPLFITNLIEGKKVGIYGMGANVRDWIYVTDHCEALWLILRKGAFGETYLVGANCELSNIEVTRKILAILDKGDEYIEYVEDRKGHDFRYAINSSKIQRELGWRAKTGFEEGLKKTVEWYQTHESWWRKLKKKG